MRWEDSTTNAPPVPDVTAPVVINRTPYDPLRSGAHSEAPHPDPPRQPEAMADTPAGAPVVAVPTNTTAVTATALQPWVISMGRGLVEAIVLAGVAVFTMLAAAPEADGRAIVIVAGGAFFTRLAAAFGVGIVDQANSKKV